MNDLLPSLAESLLLVLALSMDSFVATYWSSIFRSYSEIFETYSARFKSSESERASRSRFK